MLFSGADVLAGLCHVAKMGLFGIRAVLCCQGGGMAGPHGVDTPADGGKPCRFDREAGSDMQICHEGRDAGEVIHLHVDEEPVGDGGWFGCGCGRWPQCQWLLGRQRNLRGGWAS